MSKKEKKTKEKEIKIEQADETPEETPAVKETPTPKARIVELEAQVNTLQDKLLRNAAEFENFRRRSQNEKSEWILRGTRELVLEVCDVLDNFERAIDTGVQEHQFDSFLKGVELIHKQLADLLTKKGVQRIEAKGQLFDPMVHDAISQLPSDEPRDTITNVVQNGYLMHDRVIRPAKVVVSAGAPAPVEAAQQEDAANTTSEE